MPVAVRHQMASQRRPAAGSLRPEARLFIRFHGYSTYMHARTQLGIFNVPIWRRLTARGRNTGTEATAFLGYSIIPIQEGERS
jgi:hypothetical protein